MRTSDYIEQRDGGYCVRGTRVSLDSVVYRFLEGLSPESIQADCFPVLTLEQVYGAITYYLAHEQEIDEYLREGEAGYQRQRAERREELRRTKPELYRRLEAARSEREALRPRI